MKRSFTVTASVVLGLFFLMAIVATQAVSAQRPPGDYRAGSRAPSSVQHTQPITPGAPADVVLLLDQSESQSYSFDQLPEPWRSHCSQNKINDMYACLNGGTLEDGVVIPAGGCNGATISDPNFPELTRGICQPFRQSKEAAYRFIKQLRPDIDRVALAGFAESGSHYLTMTFNLSDALTALNSIDVYVPPSDASHPNPNGHVLCTSYMLTQDKWKCGSSNIGAGLIQTHDEFDMATPLRPEARWITVLIADGPANRTSYDARVPWSEPLYGTCPLLERTTRLKCRDADVNSRHFITATVDPLYDADDYAREYGDLLGLNPELYPSLSSTGIEIFTIGLGRNMACLTGAYTPPSNGQPATCTSSDPQYGDPDAGEQLLRYLADMGDDGNLSTGPCLDTQVPFRVFDTRADTSGRSDDAGLGLHCGNYYFAPDATSLTTITLDIAARIITGSVPIPAFSATPTRGFSPLVVTFTNEFSGDYTSLLWQFGDGATSADLHPVHTYATAGAFTVTLTLTNSTASATLSQPDYVIVRAPNIPGTAADVVLVLDHSESQSYDFASLPEPWRSHCRQYNINDMYACLNGGTLQDGTVIPAGGCNGAAVSDPNYPELTRGICQPFRKSKEAAYRFIQQLRPGLDRIALITFAEHAYRRLPLTFNSTETITALNTLDVYVAPANAAQPNPTGHLLCNTTTPTAEHWKCGSSNIGAGLILARDEFSTARLSAQWATVFIADGPANRTAYDARVPWSDPQYGNCPPAEQTTALKCRDADANSRHFTTPVVDSLYDADDYAREYGDLLGLDPDQYPALTSAGIEIFTISFGKSTVCLTGTYTPPTNGQPATCTNSLPSYGDPDAGEQLLRYIADMGDDGNLSTGPCLDTQAPFRDFATRTDPSGRSDDVGLGLSCGNYYFAPDTDSLPRIMLNIATRLIAVEVLQPDFSAAPLSGAAPLSVTFDNLSTGSYTSTLWTFGDGNTSALISPTHSYTLPGVYTVTLTIADITSTASLTRADYITAYQPVVAGFSATPLSGTAPLTVTFTNQSTGDFTNLLWDFGDGFTSTLTNPVHTYDPAGVYTVTLQANGPGGTAWFTRTDYITVYQPVVASFSATPLSGTAPLTVTFTNLSTGDFTDLVWDFGDGITSTLSNPTHTYAAGTYTVTLQVTGLGGTDVITRTNYIDVSAPPWRIYLPMIQKP